MKRILWVGALIPILALTYPSVMGFTVTNDGNSDGHQAAREDWSSGAGYHPGCTDHGIDPTQNEGYCGAFKVGYIEEWGTLALVQ